VKDKKSWLLFPFKRCSRRGENWSTYGGDGRQCAISVSWWEMCNLNQSWFGFEMLIQSFQPVLIGDPFEPE